jgi:hypothetical protein
MSGIDPELFNTCFSSWVPPASGLGLRHPQPARVGPGSAFTRLAIQPYSATEVDGWQHNLSRGQNRAAAQKFSPTSTKERP